MNVKTEETLSRYACEQKYRGANCKHGECHNPFTTVLVPAYFSFNFSLPSVLFFSRNALNFSPASRSRIHCS